MTASTTAETPINTAGEAARIGALLAAIYHLAAQLEDVVDSDGFHIATAIEACVDSAQLSLSAISRAGVGSAA